MKSKLRPRFVLFFLFFFFLQSAISQEATIRGKAESKPGELVRLIVYDDLFSRMEKTLDSSFTGSDGSFELSSDFPKTTIALLALGLKKGEFYLQPASTYSFEIPLDTVSRRGSVFDELPLQFYLEVQDDGLTENLRNFNLDYNEFVIQNTNRIYRNRDKKLIHDFGKAINLEYSDVYNEYFKNYVKYTLAQLEWVSKAKPDDSLVAEYFINQPVLYQNIQYAEFFSDFFKAKFGSTKLYSYDELISAINSNKGYVDVDRLLNRSKLLVEDAEVRELVAILLLAKKYYNPDVQKEKVLENLKELQRNSKYRGIQNVAENYINKLTHLEFGTKAPEFSLADSNGDSVELTQFEGKFILLNFNRDDCKPCLIYMQNLEELRKKFNGKVEILSLVTEEGFNEISDYNSTRNFDWPVLNLGKQILLLEDYNIRTFPAYLLIYPDLTIALATTPLPGAGLELYIKRYINRYSQNKSENSKE